MFVSFVETHSTCKVCCRSSSGICAPYQDETGHFLFLRKGKPCTVGFCDGAVRSVLSLLVGCVTRLQLHVRFALCRGSA